MKNIVCLISGRGSNLAALLQTACAERWSERLGASITAVISNRADAAGLRLAADAGVATQVIAHRDHPSRAAFDLALAAELERTKADLVVLAGFMRVLTPEFVQRHATRLVNVHPSLLPSFPGLDTHRRALAAGVRVHGATVHFVDAEVDAGPIIAQAVVPVRTDDTADSLAARVLAREHVLLPRVVRWLIEGRIARDGAHGVRTVDLPPDALSLPWA